MDTHINHQPNKASVTLPIDDNSKKALQTGALTLGGYLAGLSTTALLGHTKSQNVDGDNTTTIEGDGLIDITSEAPIATSVNDSMSFNEAFASARTELGSGGFFTWQGRSYNTYYAEEWTELGEENQAAFLATVENNASYETYDFPAGINIDNDSQDEIVLGDVDNDGEVDIQGVDLNNDGNIDVIHVSPDNAAAAATEVPSAEDTANVETVDDSIVENESSAHSGEYDATLDDQVLEPMMGQLDSNDNNIVDSIAYDKDFDGNADTVIVDINEDGYGDVAGIDTDYDGELDIVIIDEDQNGFDENDPVNSIDIEISMDEFIIVEDSNKIVNEDPSGEVITDDTPDFDLDASDLELI